MSDAIEQNLWYKIRYTPLRDALRGKLTARLDLGRALAETALPEDVKQLLRRVVKATRLWRLEQVAVLQELIAHFNDGIASGISANELVQKFGDERQAAQLIRRAKQRQRPMAWHALRFATWSMTGMLVLYFSYAMYFFAGRPSPRINYVDLMNKPLENVPAEDRGWTFYRRALIGTDLRQNENLSLRQVNELIDPTRRKELEEFVQTHQRQIEWIREGTKRAHFGWVIGANGSVKDPELWPIQKHAKIDATGEPLAMAAIPPLSGMRYLANLLRADAIVAVHNGDGKRLLQDVESTINLSRQIGDKAPLLLSLISMVVSETAMQEVEYALLERRALIKKEDWLALSRQLSAFKVAADVFSYEQERISFDDMLQRTFTDDGSGNGRLTKEAFLFNDFDYPDVKKSSWRKLSLPILGLFVPSRQILKAEYTNAMDLAESNLKVAIRDASWPNYERSKMWTTLQVGVFMPAYRRSQGAAERLLGHRDGVVTAIALELYRQEHGRYPDSLIALVPGLLPEVPVDRITGEPIHYRIADGHPLLYSVGADRKDSGGTYADNPVRAAVWDEAPENITDGDWILYPTVD